MRLMHIYRQLGEELSHPPGVTNVSFQFVVPLSHRHWTGLYVLRRVEPPQIQHE